MALPMEREPAEADLALLVGPGKGARKGPGAGMGDELGMEMGMEEEEPLPPGFESAAMEAFPEMDPAGYPALKRLIALCMEGPGY